MDKNLLEQFLKLMKSDNDSDAIMGLRGLQNLCRDIGASVEDALRYAFKNNGAWQTKAEKTIEQISALKSSSPAVVNMSGVPDCRAAQGGALEVILSGQNEGDVYPLPGESARYATEIAAHFKDAIVAAVINKSRFKLKLNDVKNAKGETVETVLQAEYERSGMVAIRIWANNRGEVGALATVLRKVVSNSLPELAAA